MQEEFLRCYKSVWVSCSNKCLNGSFWDWWSNRCPTGWLWTCMCAPELLLLNLLVPVSQKGFELRYGLARYDGKLWLLYQRWVEGSNPWSKVLGEKVKDHHQLLHWTLLKGWKTSIKLKIKSQGSDFVVCLQNVVLDVGFVWKYLQMVLISAKFQVSSNTA